MEDLLISLWENSNSETVCARRIQDLVDQGADVNGKTFGGRTPLMIVCWKYKKNDVTDKIRILLDHGADVNLTDDFGWNALHFACRYNCTTQLASIVDTLLRSNINVNATTRNNWNCLHQLCKYNFAEKLYGVMSTLIRHNIHINTQTNKNDTALHLVCRYCRTVDFNAIFELFINAGARVDIVSSNGKTLLHVLCKYAIDLDLHGVMEKILDKCQSMVDRLDYYGSTAMVYAAKLGCVKTVSLLLPYTKTSITDAFGQNVVDHLNKIFSKSFPLCLCCRRMESFLSKGFRDELDSKIPHHSPRRGINRNALEGAIPRRIDYGFTNTNRDAVIQLPTGNAWSIIKDAWTNESSLEMNIFLNFLREHTHQSCTGHNCQWCTVSEAAEQYVRQLLDTVAVLDNRFEGEIVRYGSSAENTKILSPDEFDFMLVLNHFKEAETRGIVEQAGNESSVAFQTESDRGVSSAKLLYYFYMLMAHAMNQMNDMHIFSRSLSFSETCVTLDCLYRGKPPVGTENSSFKLSIDITIAVIRSAINAVAQPLPSPLYSNKSPDVKIDQFLVPHRQLSGIEISGWKPSFPIAEKDAFRHFDPIITRCYCLLKLLILLVAHTDDNSTFRKTKPSSYAIKTCLFNFVRKNHIQWEERYIDLYCRGICNEFLEKGDQINSFFDHSLPVYVIKNESRDVMIKIKNRLESIRHCACNFHGSLFACEKFCVAKHHIKRMFSLEKK
ncbi:uncharacterized protein LOC130693199 [Daphnia carinata]|uniref:uncharacterized protein LOC130693199 n=1 Tax=Daphnia carinata TaxID=120202 RepID=UPI00286930D3|nr:uncharacterized protein LOC130693199 [Daphnia carinata]